jgi:DNA-binding IclR family transcriptional regulator
MNDQTHASNSAMRALRVLTALRGHTLNGISNGELAKRCDAPPSAITRALAALIQEGYAVKLDNGRFAPGIAQLQYAQQTANELANASDRIAELTQRIATGSHR